MSVQAVDTTVKHIQRGIPWVKWPTKCHKALAVAFEPIQGMTQDQKGASSDEWQCVRLNRHLFNRNDLTIPSFITKQLNAISTEERDYWRNFSESLRTRILSETTARSKISKVI